RRMLLPYHLRRASARSGPWWVRPRWLVFFTSHLTSTASERASLAAQPGASAPVRRALPKNDPRRLVFNTSLLGERTPGITSEQTPGDPARRGDRACTAWVVIDDGNRVRAAGD